MSIWSSAFWKATAERAIATAAEALLALFAGNELVNAFEMDFQQMGGVALGMAFISLLKSIATNAVTGTGPSAVSTEKVVTK